MTALSNLEFSEGGLPQSILWALVHLSLAIAAGAVLVLGASFLRAEDGWARTAARLAPIAIALAGMWAWIFIRFTEVPAAFAASGVGYTPTTGLGVVSLPTLFLASAAARTGG